MKDRVLHHAIFRILYPIFDKSFMYDSYSCRVNKGTHRAVNRLEYFLRKASRNNTRLCVALKLDIKKFFDSIDHDILLVLLKRKIHDQQVIWLLGQITNSFCIEEGKGIPLGNVISQLFANVYLHELDIFIKHILRLNYYIRYCDDFIILHTSQQYLIDLVPTIQGFIKNRLQLSLHEDKIILRKYRQGIDFLGYVIFPNHRVLRPKTKRRIFKKIKNNIFDFRNQEISEKSLYQSMQSYFGVLKHCNSHKTKEAITKELPF